MPRLSTISPRALQASRPKPASLQRRCLIPPWSAASKRWRNPLPRCAATFQGCARNRRNWQLASMTRNQPRANPQPQWICPRSMSASPSSNALPARKSPRSRRKAESPPMTCRFAASSRHPCSMFRCGRASLMPRRWRRPIVPPRKAGSTRQTRATQPLPRPVNSPLRPWRRSPNRGNRISMYRIILFLVLIALAAAGAAWIADQTGDVTLAWGGWRAETSLPVFVLALGIAIVAGMLGWTILRALWRMPERVRRSRRERRHARGRHAITHGLLAIGHGDSTAARLHADVARRHAAHDPLALLLHAQSAQLDGDREGAQRAFRAMAEREDTRLLGLRGLFIEAQRADDPVAAVMVAEEALKLSPSSSWASHAVLGFCCAKGDWAGALKILDNNQSAGLMDKAAYRRQRGVLLTARALELEKVDRDLSLESVMEAVKLATSLVPGLVLARTCARAWHTWWRP